MPLAEARASGAIGLFGEVYGEVVRVVDMGDGWSRELCAGTHVAQSAQVGLLAVNAESSVGSGIRRVEAFVGMEAFQHLAKERSLVMGLADSLKVQPDQVADRVARMVAQLKEAEREIAALKSANLLGRRRADPGQGARHVGGVLHRAPRRRCDRQRPALAGARRSAVGSPTTAAVICIVGGTSEKPAVVIATTEGARHRGLKRRGAGQDRDRGARRPRRRQGRPGPGRRHQRGRRGPGPDRRRVRHRRQGDELTQ